MQQETSKEQQNQQIPALPKRGILSEIFFWISRAWVGLGHDLVYYKRIHIVGKENVPPKGTPMLIACNHQNALNDALAVEFGFKDRPITIFTRADIFKKPFVAKMLRAIHLMPAFRLGVDGADALSENGIYFAQAGARLLDGGSVLVFPEAVNQDKRWLGTFSEGYLRLAFDAAEKSGFQTDIMILPMVNHYSDYFHFREEMMIKIGKPISMKEYYDQYKEKPRSARRDLNKRVRAEIDQMMLNVTDLDNYQAIDNIREIYGPRYCAQCGGDSSHLPDRLLSDKALCKELDEARDKDPDTIAALYADSLKIKSETRKNKVADANYDKKFSIPRIAVQIFALIAAFPLFLLSLIPNILLFLSPFMVTNKLKAGDGHAQMFVGGVRFALNSLIVLPVAYLLTFLIEGLLCGWIFAAVHTICLPLLGLFAWGYRKLFIYTKRELRFQKAKKGPLAAIVDLRKNLFDKLDNILSKNTWKKE